MLDNFGSHKGDAARKVIRAISARAKVTQLSRCDVR